MDFGDFAAGTDFSQESSSQDPFSQSQDVFTQPNMGDATVLTGDKLLAQPYKVSETFPSDLLHFYTIFMIKHSFK